MERKKRVATATHAPNIPSGFGRVNREIANSLGIKYEVLCIGWQFQGLPYQPKFPFAQEPERYVICPSAPGGNYNEFGQQTFPSFVSTFKPDMMITLADWFVFSRGAHGYNKNWLPFFFAKQAQQIAQKHIELVWYFPVDSAPICSAHVDLLRHIPHPVVMSKFGLMECMRHGFIPMYIPHGVDPKIFHRVSDEERLNIRRNLLRRLNSHIDPEEAFIVFWGGRNQIRKFPHYLIEIFSKFAEDKDDVYLLLHTTPVPYQIGMSLGLHIDRYNLNDKVGFTHAGIVYMPTDQFLNEIYNVADVYIDTAGGEGFGLFRVEPHWLPAIMPYWTTAPEFYDKQPVVDAKMVLSDRRNDGDTGLVKTSFGFLVPLIDFWTNGTGSDFGIVDREYFVEALNWIYYHRNEAKRMGERRSKFLLKEYNWEWIRNTWVGYIDSIFDGYEGEYIIESNPKIYAPNCN